jgi:polyisoprenoid-binding protein YceI
MKNIAILLFACAIQFSAAAQDIRISKNASISFYSSTIVEDIEGKSTTASSVLDLKSREIIFRVSNTSFQFKKKLMQEHFNENYMESDTYPFSEFRGKIIDNTDLSQDGTYTATVQGNLNIHGVSKTYQTKVSFVVAQGVITAKTVFKVRIADHKIKIPALVFNNIAEFVDVRVSAVYQPKKP